MIRRCGIWKSWTFVKCWPNSAIEFRAFTNQAQQEAYLQSVNKPHQNVHQLFYKDLSNTVESLIKKGKDVLLLGDFNDALLDMNSGMAKIVSRFKLHNLMRHAVGIQILQHMHVEAEE